MMDLGQLCFVMELMDQDLNELLFSDSKFTESHLVKVVYNALCSLAFLHEANIMHRDLKPANFLIDSQFNVKISDFGLSRTISPQMIGKQDFNSLRMRESYMRKYENGEAVEQMVNTLT